MPSVKLAWLPDPNDQEAKQRITSSLVTFVNSEVGKQFKVILDNQKNSLDMGEIKLSNYDTPSWPAKQAHLNGYRQHLQQIYDLFDVV